MRELWFSWAMKTNQLQISHSANVKEIATTMMIAWYVYIYEVSLLLCLGHFSDQICFPLLQGDLVCFQRSGTTAVPGCSGNGASGADYCYTAGTKSPTPSPTKAPTTAPSATPTAAATLSLDYIGENLGPYGECQGDCDKSSNCDVSKVGNCADF